MPSLCMMTPAYGVGVRMPLAAGVSNFTHMKARKNKKGYMNTASRVHRVKKGKGSFRRRDKHAQDINQ